MKLLEALAEHMKVQSMNTYVSCAQDDILATRLSADGEPLHFIVEIHPPDTEEYETYEYEHGAFPRQDDIYSYHPRFWDIDDYVPATETGEIIMAYWRNELHKEEEQ